MSEDGRQQAPLVAMIDDEEDVVTYFRFALEDHGYRVAFTTDPTAALQLLEEVQPSLICLDLLMPGKTGMSLYSALCRHPKLKDVPVVILSGLAVRHELPQLLEEAGGLPEPARFLEKPGTIEQFLAVVDELVDRSRAASE